jgi:hypothetical protein
MRGPSPGDNVILDLLLPLVAFLIWLFVRREFDRETRNNRRGDDQLRTAASVRDVSLRD